MKTVKIPYHTSHAELHIDESHIKAMLVSHTDEYIPEAPPEELIRRALADPVGSRDLKSLAVNAKTVVIVTSDHTRAVPSRITLPIMLTEIRSANPEADITILIATGLHRETTKEEQQRLFGDEIVKNEKIVVNNAFRDEGFEHVGQLPSGTELWVNRVALHCDLLITEGFIEPHFFAGFSGGRKSILPGICNAATVNENHSYRAISSPYAVAGELDRNPIHIDMVCAARKVNVQFTLNVALNSRKEVIAAFAGDVEESHRKGVDFVRSLAQCKAVIGDIVVTSNGGYPLDQNVYQTPKAISTAEACCCEGGVIVMCAGCVDGMGGTNFEKLMLMGTPEEIDEYLSSIPARESISEQWCAQIYSRILRRNRVILVTDHMDPELIRRANMIPARTPDEGLKIAYDLMGKNSEVVIIPDGVAVLTTR